MAGQVFEAAAAAAAVGGEEEKEESKIQQRKCVINPNGEFCKNWDLLMVALLVFTAIVTPFEVGFLTPKFDGLYVVNRFVDAGFVADMFVNFFLGYYDEEQATMV